MTRFGTFVSLVLTGACVATALAQTLESGIAPPGVDVQRVWHLGRVTGDLDRIIRFYHELLGLDLRGGRDQPRPFSSVKVVNEFVNAPPNAEFRAAFMPIQGTSAEVDPQNQIYLEAFEYRNINRRQIIPALVDPGASSLRFLVRDLDTTLTAAKAAGLVVVTPGGEAVSVPTPLGLSGSSKAIMLRDPDGYPVELMQLTPVPPSLAPAGSNILGAQMSVVVKDIDASLRFYRRFLGSDLKVLESTAWQTSKGFSQLRGIPETGYRTAGMLLPGSAITLELVQFRGVSQTPYLPVFQDIGFGHIALIAKDIEVILKRMNETGIKPLSASGTWTQINPSLRGVYTRDLDGFFLEVIERR